jgi:4'-phosphopantetheinyl transferase
VLRKNEVHVWQARLDELLPSSKAFLATLSADERFRAEHFYFPKDREHFIAAHGILRAILGSYLNRPPGCLSFREGSFGKPSLSQQSGPQDIQFNMSHSHGLALYAVGRGRAVGIDLEFAGREIDVEQIAERFFSAREAATLREMPPAVRRNAFFLCWTRKEAYIKATGKGLSMPLDQFDVSLVPGEQSALLQTRPDMDEAARWSVRDLSFSHDYSAALAVEGRGHSVTYWRW